jgi:hypothetical protein
MLQLLPGQVDHTGRLLPKVPTLRLWYPVRSGTAAINWCYTLVPQLTGEPLHRCSSHLVVLCHTVAVEDCQSAQWCAWHVPAGQATTHRRRWANVARLGSCCSAVNGTPASQQGPSSLGYGVRLFLSMVG